MNVVSFDLHWISVHVMGALISKGIKGSRWRGIGGRGGSTEKEGRCGKGDS